MDDSTVTKAREKAREIIDRVNATLEPAPEAPTTTWGQSPFLPHEAFSALSPHRDVAAPVFVTKEQVNKVFDHLHEDKVELVKAIEACIDDCVTHDQLNEAKGQLVRLISEECGKFVGKLEKKYREEFATKKQFDETLAIIEKFVGKSNQIFADQQNEMRALFENEVRYMRSIVQRIGERFMGRDDSTLQ